MGPPGPPGPPGIVGPPGDARRVTVGDGLQIGGPGGVTEDQVKALLEVTVSESQKSVVSEVEGLKGKINNMFPLFNSAQQASQENHNGILSLSAQMQSLVDNTEQMLQKEIAAASGQLALQTLSVKLLMQQVLDKTGAVASKYPIVHICNKKDGKCLQKKPSEQFFLKNPASGRCVNTQDAVAENGGRMVYWTNCHEEKNKFEIVDTGGDTFFLKNVQTGLCVNTESGEAWKGGKMVYWESCADEKNKFTRVSAEGNAFFLKNVQSGLCVHAADSSPKDGTEMVYEEGCSGDENKFVAVQESATHFDRLTWAKADTTTMQQWSLDPLQGTIQAASGGCLEAAYKYGASLLVYACDPSNKPNQMWAYSMNDFHVMLQRGDKTCLDHNSDNTQPLLYACTPDNENQMFELVLPYEGLKGTA